MNVTCPGCGMHGPLEAFVAPTEAGHLAQLMGRVPPEISDLVLRYVGLFAPAKHKMTAARGRRVLAELVPLIEARKITRNKREWDAPPKAWESAITEMLERRAQLALPLRSHGYLLEVVVGHANQVEAKAESQIEKQRRESIDRPPPVASIAPPTFDAKRFAEVRLKQEQRDAELRAQIHRDTNLPGDLVESAEETAARRERLRQARQEIEQRKDRVSDAKPLAECVPSTVTEKR